MPSPSARRPKAGRTARTQVGEWRHCQCHSSGRATGCRRPGVHVPHGQAGRSSSTPRAEDAATRLGRPVSAEGGQQAQAYAAPAPSWTRVHHQRPPAGVQTPPASLQPSAAEETVFALRRGEIFVRPPHHRPRSRRRRRRASVEYLPCPDPPPHAWADVHRRRGGASDFSLMSCGADSR